MTALPYCLISRALTNGDSFNALVNKMRGHDQFTLIPCTCSTPCAIITRDQVAELDRRVAIELAKPVCKKIGVSPCSDCGQPAKYYGPGFGYAGRCEACLEKMRERKRMKA